MKKWLFYIPVFCQAGAFAMTQPEAWYGETLHNAWGQTFHMAEKLYEEKTDEQHLVIFRNELFGKVLALDGVIQVTEGDEFIYHEMLTHVPLLAHGSVKSALVIGGGDGGILRELLRHRTIERVVLVEIDASVIAFSKKHLPEISNGSFDNPRVEIVIQDGCAFVKNTKETFDLIICDSTDPIGPGAVLFTQEFYGDCHALLRDGGIFVNQSGVPFLQKEECVGVHKNLSAHFNHVNFFLGVIPTYAGGFMAFGWASDSGKALNVSTEELTRRLSAIEGEMKYYTPEIHKAAFALPKFLQNTLSQGDR